MQSVCAQGPFGLALAFLCLLSCQASVPLTSLGNDARQAGSAIGANDPPLPYAPLSLEAQARKAKVLLTGEPVTDTDLGSIRTGGMAAAVADWQKRPDSEAKMIALLSMALQQSLADADAFAAQGQSIDAGLLGDASPRLLQNLQEMMARTVLAAEAGGQAFGASALSGHAFSMTTPLVVYFLHLDQVQSTGNKDDTAFASTLKAFAASDFEQWRTVTIRQPKDGEATTPRTTTDAASRSELVLNAPRVGFFSTPAFFASWKTNQANQARVTMNQALIAALGMAFDGTDQTQPSSLAALDGNHAAPGTACYGCHLTLDPMRQIYRQAYDNDFRPQKDAKLLALAGQFAVRGVVQPVRSLDEFGLLLAAHPAMPMAWAQKICAWANNASCSPDDAELQRLAGQFAADGSISRLVAGVVASPVTTYASITKTTKDNGVTFAVNKQEHLCPLLSQRLGLPDVCGLRLDARPSGDLATAATIASILPTMIYSRGQTAPVQANDPSLFFRSGNEALCAILAAHAVDAGSSSTFRSSEPQIAVDALVHQLMGLSGQSSLEPTMRALLQEHYTMAAAAGASPTDALRSTFVAACLSPVVMGSAQ